HVQLGPRRGGARTYQQVIDSSGRGAAVELPGLDRAKKLAATGGKPFYSEGTVEDTHVRVYTVQVADGFAIEVARSLAEVDHTLHRLRAELLPTRHPCGGDARVPRP